jgi:hypothetical protein
MHRRLVREALTCAWPGPRNPSWATLVRKSAGAGDHLDASPDHQVRRNVQAVRGRLAVSVTRLWIQARRRVPIAVCCLDSSAGNSGRLRRWPVGCQNCATSLDLVFHAARWYSLMRELRTGRRLIRSPDEGSYGWRAEAGRGSSAVVLPSGAGCGPGRAGQVGRVNRTASSLLRRGPAPVLTGLR